MPLRGKLVRPCGESLLFFFRRRQPFLHLVDPRGGPLAPLGPLRRLGIAGCKPCAGGAHRLGKARFRLHRFGQGFARLFGSLSCGCFSRFQRRIISKFSCGVACGFQFGPHCRDRLGQLCGALPGRIQTKANAVLRLPCRGQRRFGIGGLATCCRQCLAGGDKGLAGALQIGEQAGLGL